MVQELPYDGIIVPMVPEPSEIPSVDSTGLRTGTVLKLHSPIEASIERVNPDIIAFWTQEELWQCP